MIGPLFTRAVRHLAAQTFAAIGGFTARDGLVGRYGPCGYAGYSMHGYALNCGYVSRK